MQVGFVGAVTEDLPALVSPDGIASVEVSNIVNEVNQSANRLEDEGADVIVLLVHEGAPDTTYASATSNANAFGRIVNGVNPNIDAIVSGHTHLAYNHAVPVPAWAGRAVTDPPGRLGRPVRPEAQPAPVLRQRRHRWGDRGRVLHHRPHHRPGRLRLAALPAQLPGRPCDRADRRRTPSPLLRVPVPLVLGQLDAPFKRAFLSNGTTENRGAESTLSNLVAEVQRWATAAPESGAAQIALMNPGGLRQNMVGTGSTFPADLTYKQAAVVQPFANTLVNMKLTGAQLKAVLEQQWQRAADGTVPTRAFLRLGTSAGFRSTYDPARPEGDRITGMWLDGVKIAPATTYSVTVNSFLASGGDNFRALRDGTQRRDTGKVDLEAMVDYLDANSPVAHDTAQHAVGVSFAAGSPASYLPGDHVRLNLSSLAFSAAEDAKDANVTVSLGGTTLGSFAVDNTIGAVDQNDEYGKAVVDVVIPAGTTAGAKELVVTGDTTDTVVTVPVVVGGTTPAPTPTPTPTPPAEKAKSVLKAVSATGTVGEKVRFKLKVKAGDETATGFVKVRVKGSDKVYRFKVKDGKAIIKLPAFNRAGTKKLVVRYLGDDEVKRAKAVVKLKITR